MADQLADSQQLAAELRNVTLQRNVFEQRTQSLRHEYAQLNLALTMQENASQSAKSKLDQIQTLEQRLQQLVSKNEELVKENNHLLHLERLNVEFRSFEPRLRDLERRETELGNTKSLLENKDIKLRELEQTNNEIF